MHEVIPVKQVGGIELLVRWICGGGLFGEIRHKGKHKAGLGCRGDRGNAWQVIRILVFIGIHIISPRIVVISGSVIVPSECGSVTG